MNTMLSERLRLKLRVGREAQHGRKSGTSSSRGEHLSSEYTAVVKQDGDWWIGWIEEVPGVNCQEATREELLETLQVTLREALELNSPYLRHLTSDL